MKTAVSLPDEVFAEAERIARRTKKSRSRVYTEAIKEYVARHDPDLIVERLNKLIRELTSRGDKFVSAAGRRVLEQTDW